MTSETCGKWGQPLSSLAIKPQMSIPIVTFLPQLLREPRTGGILLFVYWDRDWTWDLHSATEQIPSKIYVVKAAEQKGKLFFYQATKTEMSMLVLSILIIKEWYLFCCTVQGWQERQESKPFFLNLAKNNPQFLDYWASRLRQISQYDFLLSIWVSVHLAFSLLF